jgi:NAD(P)-dependent dehydrogenase (short-subunit alcohol dehydrogenase family)
MTKVAFVTGASRGIGKAIALDLARHGFDIAPTARSLDASVVAWEGTLEETARRARSYGRRAAPIKMDLLDLDEIRSGFSRALEELGQIDVLVTSATNIDFSPSGTYLNLFVDTDWEALERHARVNVLSSLLLNHLAIKHMVERKSGIVMNVTQDVSWLPHDQLPLPGQGMCGMAIPVTRGVTDRIAPALKREVGPHGVTVIAFDPGMTLSNDESRFGDTRKAGYRPEMAHSVMVPARAATYIARCRNPAVFNGEFVVALDLVRKFGLLTESDIFPDWKLGVQDVDTIPRLMD